MSETDFKVGDVVTGSFEHLGVVTRIDEGRGMYILWPDGSCGWHDIKSLSSYKTTGGFLDIERYILSRLRSYK